MNSISIIVPVYNVEDYVIECIQSIYNQDYPNKEIIIIDDGSTDNSAMVIEDWIRNKKGISFFRKVNGGASDTRNFGIERAHGKYITFIDSDDVLLDKNIISKAITILETNKECDFVQYNMIVKWQSEYAKLTNYKYGIYKTLEEKAFAYSNMSIHGSCCDKIFRTKIFENIRFPKDEIAEDYYVITKLIHSANQIIVANFGNYGYRYRPGSTSKSELSLKYRTSFIKNMCLHWLFLDRFEICRKNFYSQYVAFIWGNITILSNTFKKNELYNIYSSPIFLRKSLKNWVKDLKYITGIKNKIKSFFVFVCGPNVIDTIRRFII